AARTGLVLQLDQVAVEMPEAVDLLASGPGALLAGHFDFRLLETVASLVLNQLVDAAEGAAIDALFGRAGAHPEAGANAEGVGGNALGNQVGDRELVKITAGSDLDVG